MAHAEESITIHRPVNTVFNFVLDGTNSPLWREGVIEIERVPGKPLGVGAAFKQGLKGPGGRRIDGDYEIVECQPNELSKCQVIAGSARQTGTYRLQHLEAANGVAIALHYEPK